MTTTNTKQIWKILEIADWTTNYFKNKGIESSRLDAEVLLADVLEIDRLQLYLNFERVLTHDELKLYKKNIMKRVSGLPVAYITGKKEFMGLTFKVTKHTLVPRSDTEILVETVLKLQKENKLLNNKDQNLIVDTCTGSGNIAISLAHYLENTIVYSIDIDEKALTTAAINASLNKVNTRVNILSGNLLEPLELYPFLSKIDVITANPPYIKTKDMKNLSNEVLSEPELALDGGEVGDKFYRPLVKDSVKYLREGGYVFLEISDELANNVTSILEEYKFKNINIVKDYAGHDRVIYGMK